MPAWMQGVTKREAYFPKGKWHSLFDNSTIDAHEGGKTVTLDLPMGHVGVHVMGGTILPMQQPALVTADVRASPLTLVVALPHLEPLGHQHAIGLHGKAECDQPRTATWIMDGQQHNQSKTSHVTRAQAASRKLAASLQTQPQMVQATHKRNSTTATAKLECGISEPGRVTACGQMFVDNGDKLEVSFYVTAFTNKH